MANAGIAIKSGDKIIETRNSTPVVRAVRPVRPPSATPAELSTKVVTVDVPATAPTVVPTASAKRAPFILGNCPSSSSISALEATPISVPNVSKISTNKNANKIARNSKNLISAKLILKACPNI